MLLSYVKDSSDFIKKVKNIENVVENCILVTLDVRSVHTNNLNNEGLETARKTLKWKACSPE